MITNDVRRVFSKFVTIDRLMLDKNTWVEIDFFASLFSEANSNPTYDELVEIDGGKLGYIPFFDQCKEQGILN